MRPIQLTVATYNLYMGADLDVLFASVGSDGLSRRVSDAWASVEGSHPGERMAAAARVLSRRMPDVIGVQEAAMLRAGAGAATRRHDLLHSLTEYLSAAGTPYRVAVTSTAMESHEFSAHLAATTGQQVEVRDRSAILVRDDPAIRVEHTRQDVFRDMVRVEVLGAPVELPRAWCAATVRVEDVAVNVFATHLEVFDATVRAAQASQLLHQLNEARHGNGSHHFGPATTVLMGDLNSRPPHARATRQSVPPSAHEIEGHDAYELAVQAGLHDAWAQVNPNDHGYTSGQDPSLRNPISQLDERVDYVFTEPGVVITSADVLGADPQDRTASGLWPSDHGCLVVGMEIPRSGS